MDGNLRERSMVLEDLLASEGAEGSTGSDD